MGGVESMFDKDINQFSNLFSDFTGIDANQLKEYLKTHNVSKLIGSPTSVTTDENVLDKIENLKRLRNLYDNLKSHDKEYRLTSPESAHNFFRNKLKDFNDREYFAALFLDSKNKVIDFSVISEGTINSAFVSPREVLKLALLKNAASILVGHNHPSGSTIPSEEDKAITERLIHSGSIMGVTVVDHVIVGGENIYSFKANGGIPSSIDSKTLNEYFERYESQKNYKFAILQLSPGDSNRYRRFTDLDTLKTLENEVPNISNYELIYVQDSSMQLSERDLSRIFQSFNNNTAHPSSYYGHSVSVSDVIVITDGENHNAYFVDAFDFKKIDGFLSNSMIEKVVNSIDVRKEYDSLMNSLKFNSNDSDLLERFKIIDEKYSGIFKLADKRANIMQEDVINHDSRQCSCCEKEMNEGYYINDISKPEQYYCSDDCLFSNMSQEDFDELHKLGLAYWTQWNVETELFDDDLLDDLEEEDLEL